jgi:hypothetical protein
MNLRECDENCKICLTYYNPNGDKILKCKHSDLSEIIMICILAAFSIAILLICFLLFLLRRKNKNLKIKNIETDERIRAEETPLKSIKNVPYTKRKISRMNLIGRNTSLMNKKRTSATTVTAGKKI